MMMAIDFDMGGLKLLQIGITKDCWEDSLEGGAVWLRPHENEMRMRDSTR